MSARDRTVIGVVVLIVVAVAGYLLLVQPKHHQADRLQSQIVSERTALTQAEAQVLAGQTAEAEYRTYAKQLHDISRAVPNDEQIPELINELQAASNQSKVGFQSVAVAASSTTPTTATAGTTATAFPSQSFTLSFTGNYFAVADLLGRLASYVRADDRHFQASGRLISISSVGLSPGGSGTSSASAGSGDVIANVTALDYDIPAALLGGTSTVTAGATGSTS